MIEPEEFDLFGELSLEGRLLIEASAGTGKTFALAALATRYVAETEITIDQLLMVTFGKLAADELRDRVRDRLVKAALALAGDAEISDDDALAKHLAKVERVKRRERLNRAIVDFDTATITTIHSFAQQVRSSLGSGGDFDPDAILQDNSDDLLIEVVTDVLAMAVLRGEQGPYADVAIESKWQKQLVKYAQTALNNADIPILPEHLVSGSDSDGSAYQIACAKSSLLSEILIEMANRRRVAGTISYGDILTQLRDALRSNDSAVEVLRRRFPVALVDEFQDTDPVQWEIFERVFGAPGSKTRLVLVGDPKQAIYGFRGANVFTYLEAAHLGEVQRRKLSTNYRSDGALIDGLEELFKDSTLGHVDIRFQSVSPAPNHKTRRLETESGESLPGLAVRAAVGCDLSRNSRGAIDTDTVRQAIANDLAKCVQQTLEQTWIPEKDGVDRRRARPNDIAVLVSKNSDAPVLQEALHERSIPCVIKQGISVLGTDAAEQWRLLLMALTRPADTQRARRVALGWFFGRSAHWVATASEEEIQKIQDQLSRWSQALTRHGVVEFCAVVWAESAIVPIILQARNGDRNMTDLNQLAGLLQSSARNRPQTPMGLLRIFDHLDDIHGLEDDDVVARQVESEALAVQILTVHKSKGLEFPIVCVPGMWNSVFANDFFQDPVRKKRVLAIDRTEKWPDGRGAKERNLLAKQEALGENLRLLYVALTRAEHQTIVWWTRVVGNKDAGLTKMLFARDDARVDQEQGNTVAFDLPPDPDIARDLMERLGVTVQPGAVAVTEIGLGSPVEYVWSDPSKSPSLSSLTVATFHRQLDRKTRRWSFSAMTPSYDGTISDFTVRIDPNDESLGDAGAADESEYMTRDAYVDLFDVANSDLADSPHPVSELPLGQIPGGTRFGTLVHEVLQEIDFTDTNLDQAIRDCVVRHLRWSGLDIDPSELAKGLRAALTTPLGFEFGSRRLADIPRADRLDELSFELRLGHAGHRANLRDFGHVLLSHIDSDDALIGWARQLADGILDVELAGHLTGSIDLVMRIRESGVDRSSGRFYLADYKTNVLTQSFAIATARDYQQDRLPAAMVEHHYPLQALLYAVALHRYLRWRVPHYDVANHFGGVSYLFLRGMTGPGTELIDGKSNGVFTWILPPLLVTDLSDLLDGTLVVR